MEECRGMVAHSGTQSAVRRALEAVAFHFPGGGPGWLEGARHCGDAGARFAIVKQGSSLFIPGKVNQVLLRGLGRRQRLLFGCSPGRLRSTRGISQVVSAYPPGERPRHWRLAIAFCRLDFFQPASLIRKYRCTTMSPYQRRSEPGE